MKLQLEKNTELIHTSDTPLFNTFIRKFHLPFLSINDFSSARNVSLAL